MQEPQYKCPRCGSLHSDVTPRGLKQHIYYCRPCRAAQSRERYWKNPQKHLEAQRKRSSRTMRKHRYGLTEDEWLKLVESQGGGCAICRVVLEDINKFHVDHDHCCCPGHKSCGKCIRGLLCNNCNVGLGYFKDNADRLAAAANYIKSTSTSPAK